MFRIELSFNGQKNVIPQKYSVWELANKALLRKLEDDPRLRGRVFEEPDEEEEKFKPFRVRYIGNDSMNFRKNHIYKVHGFDKDGDYTLHDEFLNELNHYKRFFEPIDEFTVLCEELKKANCTCTGEYIESVDGFTYFSTHWIDSSKEEHKIFVKFKKVRNTIISSIECQSIDNLVLSAMKEEIVDILKFIFK